jgi:TonB family protein
VPIRALPSSPEWVGDDAYPPEARDLELEGQVMFEALIDRRGVPTACRIMRPSDHVLLDDGTCDRAMLMRFEPPRNAGGQSVATVYRARLTWLISDPTILGAALLTAEMDLRAGQPTGCRLDRSGAVPREWMRFACITLTGEAGHFLGRHLATARRATIQVEIQPTGSQASAVRPQGSLIARRRTAFRINSDGQPTGCRTELDEGFGPRVLEYSGECGLFLTQAWIQRDEEEDSPIGGVIEIRVYVEGSR